MISSSTRRSTDTSRSSSGGRTSPDRGIRRGDLEAPLPRAAVRHFFLDSVFDRLYRSEQRQRQLFGVLSALAVFIACLGLFGLAAYAANNGRRNRSPQGAGGLDPGIVYLLSGEFTRWVLAANLLAWPRPTWS